MGANISPGSPSTGETAVCWPAASRCWSRYRGPSSCWSMTELPKSVRIREGGPRDGFQNEPEVIPTDQKIRLIRMLAASGLPRLEVTSFVRPDVIPQLADAEEVLSGIDHPEGAAYSVLIPNERGLERALAVRDRFDEVNLFLSATETHNRKNVN